MDVTLRALRTVFLALLVCGPAGAIGAFNGVPTAETHAQSASPTLPRADSDYPSLKLSYRERFARWERLMGSGDGETWVLGESLIPDATYLHEKIYIRSYMAQSYVRAGNFMRAGELIREAEEVGGSFRFRATPDSGNPGEWKNFALFHLDVARCLFASGQFRREAAAEACAQAIAHASVARRLVRFSPRNPGDAEEDHVVAYGYKAETDRVAGHLHDAQANIAMALEMLGASVERADTRAFLYREAANIGLDLGDQEGAIGMAKRAIAVFDEKGASPVYLRRMMAHNALQNALVVSKHWRDARDEFDDTDRVAAGNVAAMRQSANILARSLVYAQTGELSLLKTRLEALAAKQHDLLGPDHPQTALSLGLLGAAQIDNSDDEVRTLALQFLRRAAQSLVASRETVETGGDGGLEDAVARFVLERYLRLSAAQASLGRVDLDLGFQVAEKLRDSGVQAAIEDAALRSAAGASGLGDLVRREQDARGETQALVEAMARTAAREGAGDTLAILESQRARVAELRAVRERLDAELKQRFPEFANLIQPASATVSDVSALLDEKEAYVSLVPTDDGVYVSVVDSRGASARILAIDRDALAGLVAEIRKSTDLDSTAGQARPFARDAAQKLFALLFAPFHDQLQAKQHLVIAPAGVLAGLPFGALLTDSWDGRDAASAPWLIRRWTLSQVPSANALRALKRFGGTEHAREPLLAWGDPTFNRHTQEIAGGFRKISITRARPDLNLADARAALLYDQIPALPDTREELLAIAATLKADASKDLRFGEQATRESVLAASGSGELARKRVVAFATHGLMAGDLPNLDQPALALAATGREDKEPLAPLLTLEDVLKLKLNADWVVLSACNTAAADGKASEALSGLARGFFYAGARSLLVTQWAVETESAKLLTTGTFEYQATHPDASKAESLRQAMLKVMAMPQYSHPVFWAPYVLVGDGSN